MIKKNKDNVILIGGANMMDFELDELSAKLTKEYGKDVIIVKNAENTKDIEEQIKKQKEAYEKPFTFFIPDLSNDLSKKIKTLSNELNNYESTKDGKANRRNKRANKRKKK